MTAFSWPSGRTWPLGSVTRRIRLVTGLTLFTYVFTHLMNHALLNVSVTAADNALLVHALQDQAREWGAAAVISDAVYEAAGARTDALEAQTLSATDRQAPMQVRVLREGLFPVSI
jgi:hypothetical protein